MAKNPAEVAKRWRERMAASGAKITSGVNAVTESPMEKAAAAESKWQQGVMDAAANGRYRNGLRSVSLQQWKDKMNRLGVPRIAQGAQEAEPKVAAFMQKFLPAVEGLQREVQSMPSDTFDERLQRMVAMVSGLHQMKGSFK